MNIQPNKGLQLRMLVAILIFFASFFGYIEYLYNITPAYGIGFAAGLIIALVLKIIDIVFFGRNIGWTGHDRYQELKNRVERLSHQANIQKPEVRLDYRKEANALTQNTLTRDSKIIVTGKMLELLDDKELDAVLAHEIAHIHNKDSFVMSALVGPTTVVTKMMIFIPVIGTILLFPLRCILVFLMRFISHYREYEADKGSVAITGNKYALISAIQKLTDKGYDEQNRDLRDTYSNSVTFYGETWLQPDPQDRVEKIKQIQMD